MRLAPVHARFVRARLLRIVPPSPCLSQFTPPGLHYSTSPEGYSGIELRVDGFSHKLPVLARRLLDCTAACEVRCSRANVRTRPRPHALAVPRADHTCARRALATDFWLWRKRCCLRPPHPLCFPPAANPSPPFFCPSSQVRPSSFQRIHEALCRKHRNANMAVGKAANYARLYALQVSARVAWVCTPGCGLARARRDRRLRVVPGWGLTTARGRRRRYCRAQANVWHVDAVGAALAEITSVDEVKVRGAFGGALGESCTQPHSPCTLCLPAPQLFACGCATSCRPLTPSPLPSPHRCPNPEPLLPQAYAREFMASCHLELLLLGNISAPAALDLARALHAAARPGAALPAAARPAERCVKLPAGRALVHSQAAKNPEEENCCVEVYFQVGPTQPHTSFNYFIRVSSGCDCPCGSADAGACQSEPAPASNTAPPLAPTRAPHTPL